jgi:glycosyltransferase involved in cell wall biosynthesis
VTVVDDGSTDGTADVARAEGVSVLAMPQNGGKGAAMRTGVADALSRGTEVVVMADADLVGFRPEHVAILLAPIAHGAVMVCGLRDYGHARNTIQRHLPIITGERAVRADVLRAMPADFWRGYELEVNLNATASRTGPWGTVVLPGLGIVHKFEKVGEVEGWVRHARMAREVLTAWGRAEGRQ